MTFRDTEGGERVQEAQTSWWDCCSERDSASAVSLQLQRPMRLPWLQCLALCSDS